MLSNPLNSVVKKCFFTFLFSICGLVSFGQVVTNPSLIKAEESSNLTKEQHELNEKLLKEKESKSFPVFVKTGNITLDNENYKKAKDAWIKENPQAYEEMISKNSVIVISKEEFRNLPVERQKEIANHPEKYILK